MQTSPRTVYPTQHQLESKARHEALISQTEKLLEQLLIEFHDSIKPGLTEFGRYMKDVLICRLVLADLRHDDIPDDYSEPTMIRGKAQDSEASAGKAKALLEAKQLVYFGKKAVYMEQMWESKVFMEGWKKRFPEF